MKISAQKLDIQDYKDVVIEVGNRNGKYVIVKLGYEEYLIPIMVWKMVADSFQLLEELD